VRRRALLIAGAVLAVLVVLPWIGLPIPGLFEQPLDAPGTLNVLALCFVFGTLALSYIALRVRRTALVRARAVLCQRCVRLRDRVDALARFRCPARWR